MDSCVISTWDGTTWCARTISWEKKERKEKKKTQALMLHKLGFKS